MAENSNALINVERLTQFYNGLYSKFLTPSAASLAYMPIGGSTSADFNVQSLILNNGSYHASVSFERQLGSNTPTIRFTYGDLSMLLPIRDTGNGFVTTDEIETKSDCVVITVNNNNYAFNTTPSVNILNDILIASGPNTLYQYSGAVGDVIYLSGYSNITNAGIYMVTAVNMLGRATSVSYVCAPNKYTIYYCVNDARAKRWDPSTNQFVDILVPDSVVIDNDDETYEIATSEDISGILNS